MNLDTPLIKKYCTPGTLVQLVVFVQGSQNISMRFGRIEGITKDNIALKPHGNPLIRLAYGGDIEAKIDIHEASHITEILLLSEEESYLKTLASENQEQLQ